MHARNRTWLLGSDPVERCRQRTLPVEGGDGSTLSLDFTTGVLDPRLTFDRLSTATFINSSGLVQFANANLMTYSTPRASGSAWGTTGTVTWGSATITDPLGNATAQEVTFGTAASAIFNTAGTTVVSGITHTFSVWLRAASGTTNVRIGDANVGAVSTVTLTTTWQRFSCQYVASGTNDGGAVYSQTGTPSSTFYVWGAQVQPGSIVGELLETTGTLRRNTPRFDYDPTSIGTPRGLLIEASGNNLATNSVAMWNWGTSGPTRTQDTTTTDIFGVTGSSSITTKVVKASGTGPQYTTLSFGIPQVTVPANASVDVTFSVWIRMDGANQPKCSLGILDTSGTPSFGATFGTKSPGGQSVSNSSVTMSSYSSAECDYTFGSVTGWVRCSVSRRLNNTTASPINWTTGLVLIYPDRFTSNAATIYVCGGQIELGIGPSSWIPTGSSQGSRAEDTCYADGTNFSSWYNASTQTGTLFADITHSALSNANGGIELGNGLGSQTTSNRVSLRRDVVIVDGVSSLTVSPTGASQRFKTAISFAPGTGNTAACRNGGTVSNPALAAGTLTGINALKLYVDSSPALRPYGWIRQVKVWPIALSNATIQAITTI